MRRAASPPPSAPNDSPEQHLADTIAAGAGLVDEAMARILVESAPRRIRDLERYGVSFDSEGAEHAFGREGRIATHGCCTRAAIAPAPPSKRPSRNRWRAAR